MREGAGQARCWTFGVVMVVGVPREEVCWGGVGRVQFSLPASLYWGQVGLHRVHGQLSGGFHRVTHQ